MVAGMPIPVGAPHMQPAPGGPRVACGAGVRVLAACELSCLCVWFLLCFVGFCLQPLGILHATGQKLAVFLALPPAGFDQLERMYGAAF